MRVIRRLILLVWMGIRPQWELFIKMMTRSGREDLELEDINKRLELAIIEQEKKKIVLRRKILRHFNRQIRIHNSRFIKPKGKSYHHITMECEKLFGEEMRKVNLTLTDKLELV